MLKKVNKKLVSEGMSMSMIAAGHNSNARWKYSGLDSVSGWEWSAPNLRVLPNHNSSSAGYHRLGADLLADCCALNPFMAGWFCASPQSIAAGTPFRHMSWRCVYCVFSLATRKANQILYPRRTCQATRHITFLITDLTFFSDRSTVMVS